MSPAMLIGRAVKTDPTLLCYASMVGHLIQNYDSIYVLFFPTYTYQSFLPHDIRAFFCHAYLRSFLHCGVFIPKYTTIFLQMRINMRTKKAHICALQTSMCIWGHRKSWHKRHRIIPSAKTPSCTIELKSNLSLNQAWAQLRR